MVYSYRMESKSSGEKQQTRRARSASVAEGARSLSASGEARRASKGAPLPPPSQIGDGASSAPKSAKKRGSAVAAETFSDGAKETKRSHSAQSPDKASATKKKKADPAKSTAADAVVTATAQAAQDKAAAPVRARQRKKAVKKEEVAAPEIQVAEAVVAPVEESVATIDAVADEKQTAEESVPAQEVAASVAEQPAVDEESKESEEGKEDDGADDAPTAPLQAVRRPRKRSAARPVRADADPSFGLTAEQVNERIATGWTNEQPDVVTKSYANIFRTNVLTLFNIINFVLAALILVYGELKNMLFIIIVTVNIVVGIVQEIRSKRVLEKMSLVSAPHVDVVREGKITPLSVSEIVLDDIILLKQGMQIPADCHVADGVCEVNESLLTGEQDDVHKQAGDFLYSGSFVQAGECRARVCAVGADSFSSKLMAEAKKFKKPKSELMRSINWIIRIVTIAIFPLGILMFFNNMANTSSINEAVTGTVASVVGMIPEGLVMLTSIALAVGVIKLARKRTLVQDLYCIETLARVDVLCLDKTGTITEGSMQVEKTHIYSTRYGLVDDVMANMVAALGADGATFDAFSRYFKSNLVWKVEKTVPFSSSRKWSAADFGQEGRFIVGAPEFVLKDRYQLVAGDVAEYSSQGFRVLVLVRTAQALGEEMNPDKMRPVALIVLSDKIRDNAKTTLEYFAKQGVELKVISGDNPLTVSKVAERAGLKGADKYIDATELDTDEKIYDAVEKYTVFGRVTPKQKKTFVSALKSYGHTVGMTGDGVNDVMALKEADCSIAMASGSEASRNVAQLVLLDSDFASLPSVVAEGRRVINNIERAASLFLVKTTFSVVLSLLLIILQMAYPFEPIQLTLISGLFVGIPSFFLAIEPNDAKVTGSFLGKVFNKALPSGLTVAVMVTIIGVVYRDVGIDVSAQVSTMSFYVTSLVSFITLLWVCMPYNKERLYLLAMCLVVYIAAITATFVRDILSLAALTSEMTLNIVFILLAVFPMIIVMRAEIEAVKKLCKDIYAFFVRAVSMLPGHEKRRQKRLAKKQKKGVKTT